MRGSEPVSLGGYVGCDNSVLHRARFHVRYVGAQYKKGCRVCVAVCVLQCVCCSLVRTSDMDGLRLVGSLKLQVSFAEYRLFYRALLQ